MQRHAVELRKHIDRAQAGVQAIADWNIDDPIFSTERHGRFGAILCQGKQPRAGATAHDDCKRSLKCARRQCPIDFRSRTSRNEIALRRGFHCVQSSPNAFRVNEATNLASVDARHYTRNMCGIVGYVGRAKATPILLDGLRRLEYRGYDSAGLTVIERGHLETRKCAGRIAALAKLVRKQPVAGSLGISHTRWATHGGVNDENAHPHFDATGKLALVHNGVIENYQALKDELVRDGDTNFRSETDTEVLAHLIGKLYDDSCASTVDAPGKRARLFDAVRTALRQVIGTYGIAVVHADVPDFMIGARRGSPLVLGLGNGENFLASDVSAIVAYTRDAVYLNDFDVVAAEPDKFEITSLAGDSTDHPVSKVQYTAEDIGKGDYPHYMLKEIFEQPNTVRDAMRGRLNPEECTAKLGGLNMAPPIGVAATKSFTSQLVILTRLGLLFGRMRNLSAAEGNRMIEALEALPGQIDEVLDLNDQIEAIAKRYANVNGFLFFGRQFNF